MKTSYLSGIMLVLLAAPIGWAQQPAGQYNANTRFEQMGSQLPTPNTTRTASGAPGKEYWQQKADYEIKAELDDEQQKITGTEVITYTNKSPDELRYLWLQLDQNLFEKSSEGNVTRNGNINPQTGTNFVALNMATQVMSNKDYGFKIMGVKDRAGRALRYTIQKTMMRVDLPQPLRPGGVFSFQVDWNFFIVDAKATFARSGYEFFPKDNNYIYEIAQWFPRMAVYDDVTGWQHKAFLGQGEFTLPFGDYRVTLTVPADHVCVATGELQNAREVLSAEALRRLEQAKTATKPFLIVNQEEAEKAEKTKVADKKTYVFAAQNVRDFAFATSRKFIWDAMQVDIEGKKVWAMSVYPKEANPLWGQYSTQLVAHTLRSYSRRTIAYPYPVAISCHGPVGGMEYPMICFNGARPEPDGTYTEGTKSFLIQVVIHEVGHNFFPMIINSDERQWAWMDEGINSFCEYLAEMEWDRNMATSYGEPQQIVPYMRTAASQQMPIMASSDNIMSYGANAYAKPATALNILRETVMGRELFDYAFKEYARRWAFKHPSPADFFRTMEDASGVDLDWFWKGWFYGVEPVDMDLADVQWFNADSQDPSKQKAAQKAETEAKRQTMSNLRNKTDIPQTEVEKNTALRDFYDTYDRYAVTEADKKRYEQYQASLSPDERKLMDEGYHFYTVVLKNKGGLVMPVILKLDYEDGTNEVIRIPAEIWRLNDKEVKKVIPSKKKVAKWTLDPFFETADIDMANNAFPREPEQPSRFQLFKQQAAKAPNPMQQAKPQGSAVQGSKN
jgi:Peptidase family M1 domain